MREGVAELSIGDDAMMDGEAVDMMVDDAVMMGLNAGSETMVVYSEEAVLVSMNIEFWLTVVVVEVAASDDENAVEDDD